MKTIVQTYAVAGMLVAGAHAFADDSMPAQNSADKAQTIKQCMDRQKAKNTGMTQEAMQTVCKNEANSQDAKKSGNDLASGPQTSKPQN